MSRHADGPKNTSQAPSANLRGKGMTSKSDEETVAGYTDPVASFLIDHQGKRFCTACIVNELELDSSEVQKQIKALKGIRAYERSRAKCSLCSYERQVVRLNYC